MLQSLGGCHGCLADQRIDVGGSGKPGPQPVLRKSGMVSVCGGSKQAPHDGDEWIPYMHG